MHKRVCVSEGKKCSFFEKIGVFCFLVTLVLKFALLPYYRQNKDFFFEGKSIHVKSRRKINLQILHERFYTD